MLLESKNPMALAVGVCQTQRELSDTILKVAAGEYGFYDLLQWIIQHQH